MTRNHIETTITTDLDNSTTIDDLIDHGLTVDEAIEYRELGELAEWLGAALPRPGEGRAGE